ncbi:MFS transporter [Rhodococcus spelaei]|uniref:MFS transporter n=1 Tax=Rhodococcus spelaei TaxID=2546320 RepID=A0A541BMC2_9NOCA|nr:MFS transporter [Rhodococcus spelaei]TQF73465.1 MFS transporter [Rhodococcus spelaei]
MTILATQPVTDQQRPYRWRWAALAVLCLSLLIVVMANTALIVAAPDMTRDLNLTSAQLQWVIDGYTVPYAALMLLCGVIGDKYSRRGALLTGLLVFGGGAVFGSLADTTPAVIVARVVMGVGAAIIMPATLSLLVATFPKSERTRAIAAWAATSGLAIALGPLLAGWILESHSWSATFLINVPIAAIAAVAALILVPPSRAVGLGRIDWIGGLLSVGAIGAGVYAIINGFHFGWSAGPTVAGAAAVVGLAAFVGWELRHPQPLLDVRKLGDRTVGGATLAVLLVFLAAFGAIYFIAQQFQFVLGYGALETGVRLLPLAVAVSVGALVSGRLAPRIGLRGTVVAGMALAAAGVLLLTRADGGSGYLDFAVPLILLGLGIGIGEPPATDAIMGRFPDSDLGAAGGLNDTAIELGGSLGIAILGSILASAYKQSVAPYLDAAPLPKLSGDLAAQADLAMEVSRESVGGATIVAQELAANPLSARYAEPLHDAASVAFADAITQASLVGGLTLLVGAALVALILPGRSGS